jgi:hypothetical protein
VQALWRCEASGEEGTARNSLVVACVVSDAAVVVMSVCVRAAAAREWVSPCWGVSVAAV